ncbi:30S ribosomal protein S7 [candidate division WOR-3 bacterium]|nr:30S ribosomal protein S7 [candidate division WOR-3 bacterium]
MRRRRAEERPLLPDSKYKNVIAGKFINCLMHKGKKYLAERIFYESLKIIEERTQKPGTAVFSQAISNAKPSVEVKPRRVGGATYQIPIEVRASRRLSLAIRWIIQATRAGKGQSISKRLAEELILASKGEGVACKRKENMRKMAEANKAFSHFRW